MKLKHAILLILFLLPAPLGAASLWLSPESGIYAVGQLFTVRVFVDTNGRDINAAEADLSYNPRELSVEELSTEDSIFNLWPLPPEVDKEKGILRFAGGMREFWGGEKGLVLEITFKALAASASKANLAAGAILAADGHASNIVSALRSGVYTIQPREILAQAEYITVENAPPAQLVSSPTHPNEDAWYAGTTAEFNWKVPPGVTAVRLLLDTFPKTVPTAEYAPPIDRNVVHDVRDGIWYFHVQMRNADGWGGVGHYRLQIDTENPEFLHIEEKARADRTAPAVELLFKTKDAASGVEKYEIQIDDEEPALWTDEGSRTYKTRPLLPGEHTVLAKAIDRAGNFAIDSHVFFIESIEPPNITDYTRELYEGGVFAAEGEAPPSSRVLFWVRKGDDEAERFTARSDEYGAFTLELERKFERGIYTAWARTEDSRGARSIATDDVTFFVEGSSSLLASSGVLVLGAFGAVATVVIAGLAAGYLRYRRNRV